MCWSGNVPEQRHKPARLSRKNKSDTDRKSQSGLGGAQTRDQQDNLILGPQTAAECEAVANR